MLIEIILTTIALTLIILTITLIAIAVRSKNAIQGIETDVHNVSEEATRVLNTIKDFIQTDLHSISQETNQAINNVNDLSSDVKNKVNSINFLFRPLNSLNSKLGSELSSNHETSHHRETVPQILKWIVSSVFLIKTTKEFIK